MTTVRDALILILVADLTVMALFSTLVILWAVKGYYS